MNQTHTSSASQKGPVFLTDMVSSTEKAYQTFIVVYGGGFLAGMGVVVCLFVLALLWQAGRGIELCANILIALLTIALVLLLGLWFSHLAVIAELRGNAIEVGREQLPELYALLEEQSRRLGLAEVPPCFVLEAGYVFSCLVERLAGRDFLVLPARLVEIAYKQKDMDTLAFLAARELAVVARGYRGVFWNAMVWVAVGCNPLFFLAYERACTYTCDRIAAALAREGAIRGIGLLAVGPVLYQQLPLDPAGLRRLVEQSELSIPGHIMEWCSPQPFLMRRMRALIQEAGS